MSLLLSSALPFVKRFVSRATVALNPGALRGFFKSSSDPGRERYRRVSLTASASLIQKALTIIISFVSVPLTVHSLG
jgi:hypothetical protein